MPANRPSKMSLSKMDKGRKRSFGGANHTKRTAVVSNAASRSLMVSVGIGSQQCKKLLSFCLHVVLKDGMRLQIMNYDHRCKWGGRPATF